MKTFMFSNQQTHAAFKFLLDNSDRLNSILESGKGRGMIEGDLEAWVVEERPASGDSFYDAILEASLYEIDFENLADAVQLHVFDLISS